MVDNKEETLRRIYYSPAHVGSLRGLARLARASNITLEDTKAWLTKQNTYTLHKSSRNRYVTRPYRTKQIDRQWQADIVEMIEHQAVNDGYKYILVVIHLFSRYAWARPIKTKFVEAVTNVFPSILESSGGRTPYSLQTDQGKEFENRTFQHL